MVTYTQGNFDGNSWQEHCERMLRLKFSDFQSIPATQGDFGIDGFRLGQGWIFQCYCPEADAAKTNYEACRDKITKDIKKLIDNHEKIYSLGTGIFSRWIFLTPCWNDKQLLAHAYKKSQEVCSAISNFCTNDFRIQIENKDYFSVEENKVLGSGLLKINFAEIRVDDLNLENCPSYIRSNIERKLRTFNLSQKNFEKLLNSQIIFFMKLQMEEKILDKKYPEIYQHFRIWRNSLQDSLEQQCLLNTDKSPIAFFRDTIEEYKNSIRTDLSPYFSESAINDLANSVIAYWLGNCPLNFEVEDE